MYFIEIIGLLCLAIFPSLLLAWFLYRNDLYEKESKLELFKAFSLGIISVFPTLATGRLIGNYSEYPIVNAFFATALIEEFWKFIAFRYFFYNKDFCNEPYDGIIYASFVSLGFATLENVFYVLEGGISVALVRMFLAIPGHTIFGIFMGYFAGLAKFEGKEVHNLSLGFILAFLFHGFYDYFLLIDLNILALISVFLILIGIYLARKAIKIHQESSPFLDKKPEE